MNNADKFHWPLEARMRLQFLLATTELTFKAIAKQMSEEFNCTLSRSAIAGEKRRLGMAQMAKLPKVKLKRVRVDAPIVPRMPKREARPFTIDLVQLRYGDCRWPGGAPMDRPPFFYCGAPAVAGRPYCATHMDEAHSHWVKG